MRDMVTVAEQLWLLWCSAASPAPFPRKNPLLSMGIKEKQLKAAVIPARAPALCFCSRRADRCWLCQEVVSEWLEGQELLPACSGIDSAVGKSQNPGKENWSSHSYGRA